MSRRAFLGVVGGASLAVVAGACSSSTGPAVEVGALPDLFADREGIDAIGRHAIEVPAIGDDARTIARALRPRGAPADWLRTVGREDLRADLDRAAQADFAEGHVVEVAGWRLARTEARVAALVHLVAP